MADAGHRESGSRHIGPSKLEEAERTQSLNNASTCCMDGGVGNTSCDNLGRVCGGSSRTQEESNCERSKDGACGVVPGSASAVNGLGKTSDTGPQRRGVCESERGSELSPWAASISIPCRDEKSRRISAEPGDEPLAAGISRDLGSRFPELRGVAKDARSNRVGRLRGYGNAIVPKVAAVFVKSVMEYLDNPYASIGIS
jgi:DNA (cytosine-5)-methyltransferase 1